MAASVTELPDIETFVVAGGSNLRSLSSDAHAAGVAPDHLERLTPPDSGAVAPLKLTPHGAGGGSHSKVTPDPAMSLPGLMWNVNRIEAPEAWKSSAGSPAVTVGVADTGLDFTHSELASKVVHVEDFTGLRRQPDDLRAGLRGTEFAHSDADWAAQFGGPANTDWNGHGSWIGGNIAAALDGVGINGIAPKVKLVALKISQWCGYAYDSEILAAFTYAANHGIDVVSISFGGYTDLTKPDEALVYQQYVKTVAYAMRKGTLIVAASGNEHVRVGAGGKVLSHGSLTTPGDDGPRRLRLVRDTGRDSGRDRCLCDRERRQQADDQLRTSTIQHQRPASRPAMPTSRLASAARTSSPTTATTARASTSRRRVGRGSSTCPSGTAAAPRASR